MMEQAAELHRAEMRSWESDRAAFAEFIEKTSTQEQRITEEMSHTNDVLTAILERNQGTLELLL